MDNVIVLGNGFDIDLGLKTLATCSDGEKLAAPRIYRQYQQKLGIAQRARKKSVCVPFTPRLRIYAMIP